MRKTLSLAIIFTVLSASFILSDNNNNISLQEFYGGYLSANLWFYTDAFYGSRGDGLRMAGATSTLDFHPSFSSYNPATLAYQYNAYAAMSLIPAAIPVSAFFGPQINNAITSGENSALKNNLSNGAISVPSNLSQLNAGQASGITDFELVHPFAKDNIAIGVSREEKFNMDLNLLLSGAEILATEANQSNPLFDLSLRGQVNGMLDLEIKNIVTSVGIGRRITPEWGVGAVIEHIESSVNMNGNGIIDAMGTVAGNTEEFNTDSHNSLAQQAAANLYSEAWGVRLGTSFHFLNDLLELAGDVAIEPDIKYNGVINVQGHFLPSTINLADFTATQTNTPDTSGQLSMKLPSYIRFTFAWRPSLALDINYIHYFDGYSMSFQSPSLGNSNFPVMTSYNKLLRTNDYNVNLFMHDSIRLGFNFDKFQIGFGVILAEAQTIMRNTNDDSTTGYDESHVWVPIPLLSTGFDVQIMRYINTEVELAGLPFPYLKSTISFLF